MSYAVLIPIVLAGSKTGLPLRASLADPAGAIVVRDVASGFTEFGGGTYQWHYSAMPDGFRGSVVIHVGDVGAGSDFTGVIVHAIAGINPEEAEVGADVWSHANRTLTQTYAQVVAVLAGAGVTIHRGDTLSLSFSGLGDLSDRSELWFSGKRNLQEPDTDACLQVKETSGLVRINGQAPVAGDTGQIEVTDAVAGDITITVSADATTKLEPLHSGYYDVQVLRSDGTVTTLAHGVLQIDPDVTEAIA